MVMMRTSGVDKARNSNNECRTLGSNIRVRTEVVRVSDHDGNIEENLYNVYNKVNEKNTCSVQQVFQRCICTSICVFSDYHSPQKDDEYKNSISYLYLACEADGVIGGACSEL